MAGGVGIEAIGATQTLSPNATSVNADFTNGAPSVLVTNAGVVTCFIRVQAVAGAGSATVADLPLLGGQAAVVDATPGTLAMRVSVFAASPTTVYVTPVQGSR